MGDRDSLESFVATTIAGMKLPRSGREFVKTSPEGTLRHGRACFT